MGLSLPELRDELRETTGMDEADLPTNIADRYLNLAWWDLQDKVKFREKEREVIFNLSPAVQSYPINGIDANLDNVTSVFLLPDTGQDWVPIKKRDYDALMEGLNLSTFSQGVPTEYAIFGTSVYFDPIPDKTYLTKVLYRVTLDDLPPGGPPIPQVWHEFVLLGAAMRVFRRNGEYTKSAAIRAEQNDLALITVEQTVKEKEDFHMVGVRPMRQPYYGGR